MCKSCPGILSQLKVNEQIHNFPVVAAWQWSGVAPSSRGLRPSLQVNQRNVPGIDSAYLAMDTEEGVEVVWNEVQFSERKNFKLQEVSSCVSQQDVRSIPCPGVGLWIPFVWIIGWVWNALLSKCSKPGLSPGRLLGYFHEPLCSFRLGNQIC